MLFEKNAVYLYSSNGNGTSAGADGNSSVKAIELLPFSTQHCPRDIRHHMPSLTSNKEQ